MKSLFVLIFSLMFSSLVFAQSNCEYSCSTQCMALAEKIMNNCGGYPNPNPGPVPPSYGRIELYRSDSCSSDLIGTINPNSDCSRLASMPKTWGAIINGRCIDVSDMDSDKACYLLKAASNPYAAALYNSDTCSGDLLAYVDGYTNCQTLAQYTTRRVWGVVLNGQCRDIADMDFLQACEQFKNRRK